MAVSVTAWADGTAVVPAEKDAVVALTGTVKDEGVDNNTGLPFAMEMVTLAGAGFESTTEQVADEFGPRLEGVHWNNEISGGADRASDVLAEDPLSEAVIATVWSDWIEPVVTGNVAVVTPDGTGTDAGTARTLAIAPEIETIASPAAGLVSVTVQVVVALDGSAGGAHWTEETRGGENSDSVVPADDPLSAPDIVAV